MNQENKLTNPAGIQDTVLQNAKVEAGQALTERSSNSAIKNYMQVAETTMAELKREKTEYKALWMDANTANIKLRRELDFANEQLKDRAETDLRQVEIDKRQRAQEFEQKQELENLKKGLSDHFREEMKSNKW